MPLWWGLHSCSSPLSLSLSHEITQVVVAPGRWAVQVVAIVVLVLEVLCQRGVVLQAFATSKAVHISCMVLAVWCIQLFFCSVHTMGIRAELTTIAALGLELRQTVCGAAYNRHAVCDQGCKLFCKCWIVRHQLCMHNTAFCQCHKAATCELTSHHTVIKAQCHRANWWTAQ